MSTSMSEALEKVSDYVDQARILLQDTISPYRYEDASLIAALNLSLLEGRRTRPDLFIYSNCFRNGGTQSFSEDDAESGQVVEMEEQFRLAFLHGMVAYAIERDQEDIQDARSTSFFNLMRFALTGAKPAPTSGTTAARVVQGE